MKRSAELGYVQGQSNLGNCYYYGRGTTKDIDEAKKWYVKAGEAGNDYATTQVGIIEKEQGNYIQAVKWFKLAAERGYSDAQNRLGVRYANGEGVEKNSAQEIYWYMQAAAQGHELYDESLSYQLLELMRNHMQHQGLIVERITAIIPFNRKVDKELWYFVETSLDELRLIEKYDQKIKSKEELKDKGKWINLIGLVREYYNQINRLHNSFRDISARILEEALKSIEEIKRKYYNDTMVFHSGFGKEVRSIGLLK